jgi:hypothetical protein
MAYLVVFSVSTVIALRVAGKSVNLLTIMDDIGKKH